MTVAEKYELWLSSASEDADLIAELESVRGNETEINERFYKDLTFGTGGLRGVIGAGTNRMNIYTVGKATAGLAKYIRSKTAGGSVAIAYDCRIKSDLFAKRAASVLAENGIKVHIYRELMPTPMLSYAVRYLHCDAGIVITASHNPSKYNGYKAYGPDGCQFTVNAAEQVLSYIEKEDEFSVKAPDFEEMLSSGMIDYIGDEVIESYLNEVEKQRVSKDTDVSGLRVIYTPLHGTGNKPVRAILKRIGADCTVVSEQEKPDGSFPTVEFPNPEFRSAFNCALELAKTEKPDLLIATDPDADRIGIAVPDGDDWKLLSGNETGMMLLDYIIKRREQTGSMPERPVTVKTIVTTELIRKIAQEHGVEVRDVLTGFKFIGEQVSLLEADGEADRFIFGFEESYGYLAGSFVRDKDAIVTAMLICEMAAYYKEQGSDIPQALRDIYEKYGYYLSLGRSFVCEGKDGLQRISDAMTNLRGREVKEIAGEAVIERTDYLLDDTGLPRSNVLSYKLADGSSFLVRPSGTEPKIKIYVNACGKTEKDAEIKRDRIEKEGSALIGFEI